jgi:hypothetical protein
MYTQSKRNRSVGLFRLASKMIQIQQLDWILLPGPATLLRSDSPSRITVA